MNVRSYQVGQRKGSEKLWMVWHRLEAADGDAQVWTVRVAEIIIV